MSGWASLLLMIVSSTLIVQAFLTAQMNFDHYFGLFALSFFSLSLSFSILSILSPYKYANYCKKVKAQYFWKNTNRTYQQSQGTSWVGGRPMFVTMWVGMCDKCVLESQHCVTLCVTQVCLGVQTLWHFVTGSAFATLPLGHHSVTVLSPSRPMRMINCVQDPVSK